MSLRRKLELAFRTLLVEAGAAVLPENRAASDLTTLVVVTSQEDQNTAPALPYVVIVAAEEELISVKARTGWLRVRVIVKSTADQAEDQSTEPETIHAANVDLVMAALLEHATALRARLTSTTLAVNGIVPQGPLAEDVEERIFKDGEAWRCLCFEGEG